MNINEPTQSRAFALPFTKAANPHAKFTHEEMKLPWAHYIPDKIRNHFIAMCGEFVGTVLFLYFGLSGAQVANSIPSSAGLTVEQTGSNPQQLQYIALCFGFSLAVNAWVFFRISGGLFNPAVSLGMCLIGALPWVRGCLLVVTQILGGIVAAALVDTMFPGPLNVETTLGGGTSVVRGLFIEMMLTAQLVFTIFMLAAEKHKGTFIAPVGIGLSLFVAELTGKSLASCHDDHELTKIRRLLHWWFSKSSSIVWSRSCQSQLCWLPLDLLARPRPWCHCRRRFLQIYQSTRGKFIDNPHRSKSQSTQLTVTQYETANPGQDSANRAAADRAIAEEQEHERVGTADGRPSSDATLRTNGFSPAMVLGDKPVTTEQYANGTGFQRPAAVARLGSNRFRNDSPAMASADEQFSGLSTVHADERPINLRSNSRIV